MLKSFTVALAPADAWKVVPGTVTVPLFPRGGGSGGGTVVVVVAGVGVRITVTVDPVVPLAVVLKVPRLHCTDPPLTCVPQLPLVVVADTNVAFGLVAEKLSVNVTPLTASRVLLMV
jgi:hypothetical protein